MATTLGSAAKGAKAVEVRFGHGAGAVGMDPDDRHDPGGGPGGGDHLGRIIQAGGHVDHQEHPGFPGPAQYRGLIGEVILQVQVGVRVG